MIILITALLTISSVQADPQHSAADDGAYARCIEPTHAGRGRHGHVGSFEAFMHPADLAGQERSSQSAPPTTAVYARPSAGPSYSDTALSVEANRLMTDWIAGQQATTSAAQDLALAAELRLAEETERRAQAAAAAAARQHSLEGRLGASEESADAAREEAAQTRRAFEEYLERHPPTAPEEE